jgi:hypothetical protein
MENRKPFQLRKLIVFYNFLQVIFSAWLFWGLGTSGWFTNYSLRCQPVDYSNSQQALRVNYNALLIRITREILCKLLINFMRPSSSCSDDLLLLVVLLQQIYRILRHIFLCTQKALRSSLNTAHHSPWNNAI